MQDRAQSLEIEFLFDFGEGGDGLVEVCGGVGGADLGADAGLAAGDDGEEKADGVDAEFEEAGGDFLGESGVADHDGNDGVFAGLESEAGGFESGAVVFRVGLEFVAEFRRFSEEF